MRKMSNISEKNDYCLKPIRQVGQLDAKTFFLGSEKESYTVGWSIDSDFCLNCINVNPHHSVLSFSTSGWRIKDVSGDDWTVHLNWEKIDKEKSYELNEGDVLAFGIGINSHSYQQYQYIFSDGNRDTNLFNFDTLTYRILHLGSNENEKELMENELIETLEKLKENCEFLGRGLRAKHEEIVRLRAKFDALSNEGSVDNNGNTQIETNLGSDSMENLSYSEAPTLPISFLNLSLDRYKNKPFLLKKSTENNLCQPASKDGRYLQADLKSNEISGSFSYDETEDWCVFRKAKTNQVQLQYETIKPDVEHLRLLKLLAERDHEIQNLQHRLNGVTPNMNNENSFSILDEDDFKAQQMACKADILSMFRMLQEKEKELRDLKELLQQPCERQMKVYHVLKSELTCSICVKLFNDAVTLTCSHSFCRKCIEDWMKVKDQCPACTIKIKRLFKVAALNSILENIITENS